MSVHDAAAAYLACMEAPSTAVTGQIFNIVGENARVSELGLRIQAVLEKHDIRCEIVPLCEGGPLRNYRASGQKAKAALNFATVVSVEDAAGDIILQFEAADIYPRCYNINWMCLLQEAEQIIGVTGSLFDVVGTK